jgi:hypothetical protein
LNLTFYALIHHRHPRRFLEHHLAVAAMHDEAVQIRAGSDNFTPLIAAIPTDDILPLPFRLSLLKFLFCTKPYLLVEARQMKK